MYGYTLQRARNYKPLQFILKRRKTAIIVLFEAAPGCLPLPGQVIHPKRRHTMGEKGSKKDKNKANKQKKEQLDKKKEQQKNKLPAKKPA